MTEPFKSVADWWEDYSTHAMPDGGTVEQERDMKRAFHAGVPRNGLALAGHCGSRGGADAAE